MQFPNGVNKSNLIKLGVLGAAVYMMKNRNKPTATLQDKSSVTPDSSADNDNNAVENAAKQTTKTTAFTMGKDLAAKLLGKK